MEFPEVSYATWRRTVERELGEADFEETLVSHSAGGLRLEPLYAADGPLDVPPPGEAGAPPFTRGAPRPTEASRPWRTCQSCDAADPAARSALADDLAGGGDGIWLRLPPGVESVSDLLTPDLVGSLVGARNPGPPAVILDAGLDAPRVASRLLGAAHDLDPEGERSDWHAAFDPLAAAGATEAGIQAFREQRGALADLAASWAKEVPGGRSVAVSTVPWHLNGVGAPGQLGLGLATMVEYLRWMNEAGMALDLAAGQILWQLPVGREIFPAVAMLRACRRLSSRVLEACGLSRPPAPRIHALTEAGASPARPSSDPNPAGDQDGDDPWMEALRTTHQTFAAIVGGADFITTFPESSEVGTHGSGGRLARNTQVVLAEESRLGAVDDPAGGSWFVESLTDQLARAAWAEFQEIERLGGMSALAREVPPGDASPGEASPRNASAPDASPGRLEGGEKRGRE